MADYNSWKQEQIVKQNEQLAEVNQNILRLEGGKAMTNEEKVAHRKQVVQQRMAELEKRVAAEVLKTR